MTYESVVFDMVERFPEVSDEIRSLMDARSPLPYAAFPYVLDLLKDALLTSNQQMLARTCTFIEDVAESSRCDVALGNLLKIEFGTWLRWAPREEMLAPHLGPETKRVCSYVPGLSTQRLSDRAELQRLGFWGRLLSKVR